MLDLPVPESSAPSARRYVAFELDRSARSSKLPTDHRFAAMQVAIGHWPRRSNARFYIKLRWDGRNAATIRMIRIDPSGRLARRKT